MLNRSLLIILFVIYENLFQIIGDFYFCFFRAAPLNFVKSVSQNSK